MRTTIPALFLCILLTGISFADQGVNFSSANSKIHVIADNSSVPIVDYGCQGEIFIGDQRNPITIAQTALEHYDAYARTNDKVSLQKFLNNSDWLVENAATHSNYSLLEYQFPWPPYKLQPPWNSAMAQSFALDVLIKADEITSNKKYLNAAKSLLNALFVEVKDGGVTQKTPGEGWWYEEYASPEAVESRVLNGHTSALLNLYKYFQYTGDPAAKYLFDQGIIALRENLPRYEYTGGRYSTYDVLNNTVAAPLLYHIAQTSHLGQLFEITGEEIFKDYHDKWTKFFLPEAVAQGRNIYNNSSNIELSLALADEDFIPIEDRNLTIHVISGFNGNMPAKFRVEGDGENRTTRFTASEEFFYIGKNISVTMGDQVKSFTNLNISFVVIKEGFRDEYNLIFHHGPTMDGWHDAFNYFIGIDSNSSKNISVRELFGEDIEYMVVKQLGVEVPKNACTDSMEFEVNLI